MSTWTFRDRRTPSCPCSRMSGECDPLSSLHDRGLMRRFTNSRPSVKFQWSNLRQSIDSKSKCVFILTKNLSAHKSVARYDGLSHSFSSWNLRITYPLNIMYTIFLIIFDEDLIHTCACASFTQIWRRTNKRKRGQKYWYDRKQTQVIHDSVIRKDISRYYREGSPSHKKNINTQKKVRKKCQSECNLGVITNDTYWNNVILKKNNSIYTWIHDKYEQIFLSRKRHR